MKAMYLALSVVSWVLISVNGLHVAAAESPKENRRESHHLHLDLEMTGQEYLAHLEQHKIIFAQSKAALQLQDILNTGKRNLDWLKVLNENRSQKISFSSRETQQGYPMHSPREYNPKIVRAAYQKLKDEMPKELAAVIFSQVTLPTSLPVSDEKYIEWGLKTDRVYQIAARWLMMEPYMAHLRSRQSEDVRGFYFLSQMSDRKSKLSDFQNLPAEEQNQIQTWLIQMCLNSRTTRSQCQQQFSEAARLQQLENMYSRHFSAGQNLWNKMMKIPSTGRFKDVRWQGDENVRIPFRPVKEKEIADYLQKNLEEEWQAEGFRLFVDFNLKSSHAVFVTFEPGVTPHVPYLGASEMVMDANAPITEYDVQWTIRHEFGHVLGFPDCYVEFYNEPTQSIISYQLDITDLMCSRRGQLNARHVAEMKRNYGQVFNKK